MQQDIGQVPVGDDSPHLGLTQSPDSDDIGYLPNRAIVGVDDFAGFHLMQMNDHRIASVAVYDAQAFFASSPAADEKCQATPKNHPRNCPNTTTAKFMENIGNHACNP